MLITEMLAKNARMYGSEIALVERHPEKNLRHEMTWQEFNDQANQLAQALIKRGVKKGDRVVLLMTNCIEWLPIYFGILRLGALAVPLNFRFDANSIQRCIDFTEAKAIFFGEEFVDRIHSIQDNIETIVDAYIFCGPVQLRPDFSESYSNVIQYQKFYRRLHIRYAQPTKSIN